MPNLGTQPCVPVSELPIWTCKFHLNIFYYKVWSEVLPVEITDAKDCVSDGSGREKIASVDAVPV